MAKRKRRKAERDVSNPLISNRLTPTRLLQPLVPPRTLLSSPLQELGDRRRYNPTKGVAPPAATRRSATRLVSPLYSPLNSVRFAEPKRVAICVRRKQRKEVLHAKRIAGGKGGFRKRRNNFWSKVSC